MTIIQSYCAVFCGCLSADLGSQNKSALSPAAVKWQYEFIKALSDYVSISVVISHIPYSIWPNGPFYVPHQSQTECNIKITNVSYINLPLIRDACITLFSLSILFPFILRSRKSPIRFFTYNRSFKSILCGSCVRAFKGIWIEIFADGRHPSFNASATIFLSNFAFNNYKKLLNLPILFPFVIHKPVDILSNPISDGIKPFIMYAGAINEWTGIVSFAQEFVSSELSSMVDLYIFGKPSPYMKVLPMHHSIKYFGFLAETDLNMYADKATAFINPRPSSVKSLESLNNFPSKLSYYLSFGKPVFSTKIDSLHPSMLPFIFIYHSIDDIPAFLACPKVLMQKILTIRSYSSSHTWNSAIQNTLAILDSVY